MNKFNKLKRFLLIKLGVATKKYAFIGPRRVELHLTNKCNQNCVVCWVRSPYIKNQLKNYHKQELSYDTVINLIDELYNSGVQIIHISGGGEPLMHPDFWNILKYIKSKGIICRLNTNFSLISKNGIEKLFYWKLDELFVSLWAGSAESYSKTHPNAKKDTFFKIEQGLNFLAELKNKHNQKKPSVSIYNVLCGVNYSDIDAMIEFSKKINADKCIFSTADIIKNQTDMFALTGKQKKLVIEKMRYLTDRHSNPNAFFVGANSYINQKLQKKLECEEASKKKRLRCYTGWLFSIIEASGNISFCCKSTAEPLGNIKKESFKKIWNGADIKKFRKAAVAGNINFHRISSASCEKGCDNIEDNAWFENLNSNKN